VRFRRGAAAGLVACALFAGGCGSAAAVRSVSEQFAESRVDVEVHLETSAGATVLVATFRPTSPDLHLYGLALPRDGIDGAGRPTRLDVVDPVWLAVGPLTDEPLAVPQAVAGFDAPFPTYPEGPVILRQAVAPNGPAADRSIDVQVTFMACSTAGLCYRPEIAHPMAVPAP
jgi:hypothetical protein